MKIPLVSPMLAALRDGVTTYEPDRPGLIPEHHDPATSLANARHLFSEGLTLSHLIAGPGGLLFVFDQGEEYLATGLRPGSKQLGQLLAELGYDDLADFFVSLPADFSGPIVSLF